MPKKDPRIDEYIANAQPFARPILKKLRRLVHIGCPGVEETLKWSMPAFEYKGLLCGMAAFKAHCTFGFWKSSLLTKRPGDKKGNEHDAMGQFGRIGSVDDLPEEHTILAMVREAAALNEQGVKVARAPKPKPRALVMPADLKSALAKKAKAKQAFEGMSPSHRREYVEWIVEAKRDETRAKRLETTVNNLGEGKTLRWKYEAKPKAKTKA